MTYPVSRVKTWSNGETLTHTDLNGEFDNVLTNVGTPANINDYSANASQMQTQTDPYPGSAESLATTLAGEIERIRYLIAQITNKTYWYQDPSIASKSPLNVEQVDGFHASAAPGADTVVATNSSSGVALLGNLSISKSNPKIILDATASSPQIDFDDNTAKRASIYYDVSTGELKIYDQVGTADRVKINRTTGAITIGSDVVWNAGNDGAGSGLHADALDDGTNKIHTKIINIGDWNMYYTGGGSGTLNVSVAHGLTASKIISVTGHIINDDGNAWRQLSGSGIFATNFGGYTNAVVSYWDATNVSLFHAEGGIFDSNSFDSTSYNRGKLAITYIE